MAAELFNRMTSGSGLDYGARSHRKRIGLLLRRCRSAIQAQGESISCTYISFTLRHGGPPVARADSDGTEFRLSVYMHGTPPRVGWRLPVRLPPEERGVGRPVRTIQRLTGRRPNLRTYLGDHSRWRRLDASQIGPAGTGRAPGVDR